MIPEKELEMLIKYSIRNEDFDLELKKDAPKKVVEIAKEYHWKPFDIVDGVKYQG